MKLPDQDERYLNEKGFKWRLEPNGADACLIIHDFPIDSSRFSVGKTDVMVRIPPTYPMAGLDMFYADPWISLRQGGFPVSANVAQEACGRRWQRFSRHLQQQPWRPGKDCLASFFTHVASELQAKE